MTPVHDQDFHIKCTHNTCQLLDAHKKKICLLGTLEFDAFLKNKNICDYQLFQTIHAKIFAPSTKDKYKHFLFFALQSIKQKVGSEMRRFISHRFTLLIGIIKSTERHKLIQQCTKEARGLIFDQVFSNDARDGIKLVKSAIQNGVNDIESTTFNYLTNSAIRYKPPQTWKKNEMEGISMAEDVAIEYNIKLLLNRFRDVTMADKLKYYDALHEYMENQDLTPCMHRINALTLGQRQPGSIFSSLPLDIYRLIVKALVDTQCALTAGHRLFQPHL